MSSLSIRDISKSFGAQPVLRDVSLEIASGEFFFLLGPSGCGKSTLLRIIAGLERPDTGSILVDGRDMTNVPPQRRGIGMVFQQYALWPHMTVAENIRFGLRAAKLPKAVQEERLKESLELVRMTEYVNRYPHEISGGQQQRIAVARALALQPKVLLLDEPLSNLDARLRDEIRGELKALHDNLKITIVYVTHDQEDALALATRMVLLNGGKIVQEGTPVDLYRRPQCAFSATFLGDANVVPVTVGSAAGRRAVFFPNLEAPVPCAIGTHPDGPATLCLRPEFLRVSKGEAPGIISGRVSAVTFRGSYEDFEVTLPGGTALRGRLLAPSIRGNLAVGDQVSLGWSPEDATLLSRAPLG